MDPHGQDRAVVSRALRALALALLLATPVNPQVACAQDDKVAKLIERAEKARYAFNWSSAQKLAREALQLDPNQWRAHAVLGGVAKDRATVRKTDPGLRSALYSECVAEYRRALSIQYVLGIAHGAVQCALDAGDPSSAVQITEEHERWLAENYSPAQLATDGNYAICRGKKGEALAALDRQSEAIAEYESSVRVGLAIKESDKARAWQLPTFLRPYNEYRARVGLPAISADQLTAATAESVAAELRLSSAFSAATAIPNPGSSAAAHAAPAVAGSTVQEPGSAVAAPPAQLPPALAPPATAAGAASGENPCGLESLALSQAINDDISRMEAADAETQRLVNARDLRGTCNAIRKYLPVHQRIVAQLERTLEIVATCPGLAAIREDRESLLGMARSTVAVLARSIESCPPEQHRWQQGPAIGELGYLVDAQRRTVSSYPAVWVRVTYDGKRFDQLYAFDCGGGRVAVAATIQYADAAATSVSGWSLDELSWESDDILFTALGRKACH